MHPKKIVSLVVTLIGVFLIVYALYSSHRISNAKHEVNTVSKNISDSSIGKMMSKEMSNRVSQYDNEVMWCLIAGIVLIVAGGGSFFYLHKHKHRR
jgi:hypothetical protein